MKKHNDPITKPEAELLRRLVIRHEFDRLATTPIEPVSVRGKAKLLDTLKKYGVAHAPAVEALPARDDSGLAELLNGATKAVFVGADKVRRLIGSLVDPTALGLVMASPVPSMRHVEPSDSGTAAPVEKLGWYLRRINSEPDSSAVELILATDTSEAVPQRVRVLAWSHDAVERIRSASGEVKLQTGDVYSLFDGLVEHADRVPIQIQLPDRFRWKPSATSVRIPVDENGVLQIALEMVGLR